MSRQAEARKQNRTVARGVETQNEVDYVSQPRSHNKQQATNNQPVRPEKKEPSKNGRPCFRCGRQNHDRNATKRDISSLSVSVRNRIRERYMQ